MSLKPHSFSNSPSIRRAKLAALLLNDMDEWYPEKITKAMHGGKERYVKLRNKVLVFISHFTAFIDRDNRLNFRKEIYNLDNRLASMIIPSQGLYYKNHRLNGKEIVIKSFI